MTVHDIDPNYSDKIWPEFWEKLKQSGSLTFESCHSKKDGKVFPVECTVTFFKYKGKEYHCGFARDITERKKAEEEIAKLAKFPEENPLPILRVSAEGTVLYSNKPGLVLLDAWGCQVGQQLPAYVQRLVADTLSSGRTMEIETKCGDRVFSVSFVSIAGSNYVNVYGRDITEHRKAKQRLLDDQAKLKSLASQLTLAEEHERRRLATELHDRISQALVISKIKLDALRKSGRSRKLDKALEDVCNCIGQTIQDTRTLTFDLSSPVLYELGFETAVSEWLTDQVQKKHGITVEFEDDGEDKPLDDDVRILLFRDVRELLTNVVKHAGAHKVKVSIRKLDNHICVTVEDDGVGFDPAEVTSGAAKRGEFGLFSIRERLEDLGGHLQIDSAPGQGCKVTMTAPLKRKEITNGRNKTTR
jgi:signal transduction histidine kinase